MLIYEVGMQYSDSRAGEMVASLENHVYMSRYVHKV
jgi:hypothetical protein